MRRPPFRLITVPCKRCGRDVTTCTRALFPGLEALRAKYAGLCHDCMTDAERAELESALRRTHPLTGDTAP
jgi:hypothetical protein